MPYADPARQRDYQARWIAQRRTDWFKDKACVDCGTTKDLRLDHVDAKDKISHRIWSWAPARRLAELAKCVARCEPCHMIKTKQNLEQVRHAKISPELAEEIRRRYAVESISQVALGQQYGIGQQAVSKIIRGQRWSATPS